MAGGSGEGNRPRGPAPSGDMGVTETAGKGCSRRAPAHGEAPQDGCRPVAGGQDMVRPISAGRLLPGQHRVGLREGHLCTLLPHPAPRRGTVLHGGDRRTDARRRMPAPEQPVRPDGGAGAEGMAPPARRGRGLSLLPDGNGLPPGGTLPAGLPVRRLQGDGARQDGEQTRGRPDRRGAGGPLPPVGNGVPPAVQGRVRAAGVRMAARASKEEILAMLSDAEIPLSVVATRNGFHSLSTLADYCQRNFGKSPSQIRKSTAG